MTRTDIQLDHQRQGTGSESSQFYFPSSSNILAKPSVFNLFIVFKIESVYIQTWDQEKYFYLKKLLIYLHILTFLENNP